MTDDTLGMKLGLLGWMNKKFPFEFPDYVLGCLGSMNARAVVLVTVLRVVFCKLGH